VAVLLVAPVPPLVELTLPVVFILDPEVVGVTFTLTAQHKLTSTPHTTQSICVSQRRRTNPEPSHKNPLNLPKRATHNRGFAYNRDHSARAHGGLYAYAIVNDWIPGDHQSDLHRRAAEFNLHGHSIVSHADIWV